MSFEGPHRVEFFNRNGSAAGGIGAPSAFDAFPVNSGPEAIEVARDGSILVAMESIPAGATHVRIGTALFGARDT